MLLNISQAARELGISYCSLRKMIKRGEVPYFILGPRMIRIDLNELKNLARIKAEARMPSKIAGPWKGFNHDARRIKS